MDKSTIATVLTVTMLVALFCGCVGLGKGPTDEELIAGVLADWKAALEAQDLDKLMVAYSEDFEGERGAGKAEVREFLSRAIDEGYLEGVEADLEDAETVVEGETASVGPVTLSSDMGSMSLDVTMQKEEVDRWRIVSTEGY